METIAAIVGLIALIVFFVMAMALRNISRNVNNINHIITIWGRVNGLSIVYKCKKCDNKYTGKLATCPHCGDVKTYD